MDSAPGPHVDAAAKDLLEPAWQMRWRVPELALVLSDRAVAQARANGDGSLRLRAESLALFASNRLGRGAPTTQRAIAAVRAAESAADDEMVARLRVELAGCARSVSSHDVALRVLDPVLERERIDPVVRAHALVELAFVLPSWRRDGEGVEALDEADRLFASSDLERDAVRLWRARVTVARACHFRRNGDFASAVRAADGGLELLAGLGDPQADSGELSVRLVLERVHALLDLGHRAEAVHAAGPIVGQPVRAAGALPAGWLRLALATRVHLPEGEHPVVVRLLNDAAADAERHRLDGLLTEALGSLSHVHEREQDFKSALDCLRGAYAADRRWRSVVHGARLRLAAEFPASTGAGRGVAAATGTTSSEVAAVGAADAATRAEATSGVVGPGGEADSTGAASNEVSPAGVTSTDVGSAGVTSAGVTVSPPESFTDDVPPEDEETRPRRRRSEGMDAEAARRLVETLTSRAAERSAQESADVVDTAPASGRRAVAEPHEDEATEPVDPLAERESAAAHSAPPPEDLPAEESPPASDPAEEVAKLLAAIRAESAPKSDEVQQRPTERSSASAADFPPVDPDSLDSPSFGSAAPGTGEWSAGETEETWETTVPEPSESPELTTIMPVIPAMSEPADELEVEAEPLWQPDPPSERRPRTEPHRGAASRSELDAEEAPGLEDLDRDDAAPQREASAWRPAEHEDSFPLFEPRRNVAAHAAPDEEERTAPEAAAPWDIPEQASAKHSAPAAREPAARDWFGDGNAASEPAAGGFDQESPREEERGGRRSRGKSLAEIRASLHLVQDAEQHGRRHARHADPEEESDHADGEPAGELLARHGQWSREQHAADEAAPEAEREVPADVGLADLLAEALMAYQNVGAEESGAGGHQAPGTGGRRRAVPDAAETGTRSRHAQPSTSDSDAFLARHRRGAMGSGDVNPPSWSSSGN